LVVVTYSWETQGQQKSEKQMVLRHSTYKAACVFVFDKRKAHADMAAAEDRTGKVFCNLVQAYVAVIDFEEKLHGALQPDVQTSQAGGFDDGAVVEIAQVDVFEPAHQKSSADGMRL
jgi:hypothetical protein